MNIPVVVYIIVKVYGNKTSKKNLNKKTELYKYKFPNSENFKKVQAVRYIILI